MFASVCDYGSLLVLGSSLIAGMFLGCKFFTKKVDVAKQNYEIGMEHLKNTLLSYALLVTREADADNSLNFALYDGTKLPRCNGSLRDYIGVYTAKNAAIELYLTTQFPTKKEVNEFIQAFFVVRPIQNIAPVKPIAPVAPIKSESELAIENMKNTLLTYALYCTRTADVNVYHSVYDDGEKLPSINVMVGNNYDGLSNYMHDSSHKKDGVELYLKKHFPTQKEVNGFVNDFFQQNERELLLATRKIERRG